MLKEIIKSKLFALCVALMFLGFFIGYGLSIMQIKAFDEEAAKIVKNTNNETIKSNIMGVTDTNKF